MERRRGSQHLCSLSLVSHPLLVSASMVQTSGELSRRKNTHVQLAEDVSLWAYIHGPVVYVLKKPQLSLSRHRFVSFLSSIAVVMSARLCGNLQRSCNAENYPRPK
ncbi:hypothetical protein C8R45DRAFT_597738 [Mycena sanguinolenta]|nr:hypothetical protein C8R45DRAFT_597738 [Mycena sanguinolenta]